MTSTPAALDQHVDVCAGLARTTPLLCDVFERSEAGIRPTRMRWTNAEIAAHMVASVTEAEKAARGQPSAYDGEQSAELDERMVAAVPERDPAVLAGILGERTSCFAETVSALDPADSLTAPRATVGALTALLALDHHLHGGQVAETSGDRWTSDVTGLHAALSTVVPYAFDSEAARGFRGSFALRLRGIEPVTYSVDDGRLTMGVPGRADSVLTTDVPTFLRMGIGAVSQARAILTGRMRAGGRRPWLAARARSLFPPIPHGGVAR